jgi:hypothetical protein
MSQDAQPVANTPVYESKISLRIRYPGPSPEEAYALHKQFVSRIKDAAESIELLGVLGVHDRVEAELTDFEGPVLVIDQEPG